MATIKELVEDIRKKEIDQIKIAKMKTPPEYHDFIILIRQNQLLLNRNPQKDEYPLPEGVFAYDGKTYVSVKTPYCKVDGRVKMFVDAHLRPDGTRAKFTVESNIEKIQDIIENTGDISPKYPLVVRIHSEIFGTLEGVSKINWGGKGADATNPLENAYTSAVGRALALGGFGLIGTGIASAEEIEQALAARGVVFEIVNEKGEEAVTAPPQETKQELGATPEPSAASVAAGGESVPQQSTVTGGKTPRQQFFEKLRAWAKAKGYDWGMVLAEATPLVGAFDDQTFETVLNDFEEMVGGIEFMIISKMSQQQEQPAPEYQQPPPPMDETPVGQQKLTQKQEPSQQQVPAGQTKPEVTDFKGEIVIDHPGVLKEHKGKAVRFAKAKDGRLVMVDPSYKIEKGTCLSFVGKTVRYQDGRILIVPNDLKRVKVVKKPA